MCYDLPSGRRTGILANRPASTQLAYVFSPDGKSLYVSLSDIEGDGFNEHGFGQIWDAVTGRPTSPLMAGTHGAHLHPCGRSSCDRD